MKNQHHRDEYRLGTTPQNFQVPPPPYWAASKKSDLEQPEIYKKFKAVVMEPAMSECPEPVLFYPKKNRKVWFCVNYRKLNTIKVKANACSLPRIDECIDTPGDVKYFTALDPYFEEWKMKIRKKDRLIREVLCHAETSQCTRIPFVLKVHPLSKSAWLYT